MSVQLAPEKPSPEPSSGGRPVKTRAQATIGYDAFVDERVRKTSAAVKGADLAAGLGTLLAMGLGFLLLVALVEHWLLPWGLSTTERAGALAIALIGAGAYAGRRLAPLVTRRINPLYAALEIERDAPGLKNSLINLLQLRSEGRGSAAVRQALERQAAERLAGVGQTEPDRSTLLRTAWVVLALVIVIALYVVLSPKDFFTTAQRIVMPWADIAAPSRVQIEDLHPGAVTLQQGETLTVSARVLGLREGEEAKVVFSTENRSLIDRRVSMDVSGGGARYTATLGDSGALGLQSDLWYRVEAGDARSKLYEVRVLASPTIAPVEVRLDYPEYTGFLSRTIESSGDLVAIEGTRVTLTAEANLDIESAQIDLGSDGRLDVRLKPDGARASGTLVLSLDEAERLAPLRTTYLLRFTATDGQANHDPAQYRLEITPDYAPEATIVTPEEEVVELRVDESLEIVVEALDPDFGLGSVRLQGETQGRTAFTVDLLRDEHRGKFRAHHLVTPRDLGLAPGEQLQYWVEAADNRTPQANRAASPRKTIIVVGPAQQPDQGEPGAAGQQGGQGQPDPNQDPEQQGQQEGAESGASDGSEQHENSPQSSSGSEGERGAQQDGGQDQNREQQDQGEHGKLDPQNQQGQQSGEQQQENDPQQDGNQSGQQQPGGMQAPGEESPDAQPQDQQQPGQSGESEQQQESPSNGAQDGQPGADSNHSQDEGQRAERRPGEPTGGEQRPVPKDGSDDGQAFERIRDHLKEQEQERGESSGESDSRQRQPGDPSEGWRPRDSQEPSPDRPDPQAQGDPSDDRRGEQSESQSSEAGGETEPGQESKETATPRDGIGESGESQAADDGSGQSADRGPGESTGQSGEEQTAEEQTGQSGEQATGEGSQSRPSEDSSQSENTDSQGSNNGGEKADDAHSQGLRENGSSPPSQDQNGAQEQTGESPQAEQNREGSEGQPGEDGTQESGENQSTTGDSQESPETDSTSEQPSDQVDAAEGDPSPREGQQGDPGRPGERQGDSRGGVPGDRTGTQSPTEAPLSEPGGDEANLEYARRQTKLVLEELSDQLAKDQVDQELLDKLGWTEQDLQRFLARWQERKQRAEQRDPRAQGELDDALRSLGLKPAGPMTQQSVKQDELRDLRQRVRTAPPPELRDRMRQYNRGVSTTAPSADGS